MNASELLASLKGRLLDFDENVRAAAVAEFAEKFPSTPESALPEREDYNLHCHTFYSFNKIKISICS